MARSSHASSNQASQINNHNNDQFGQENTRNDRAGHQQQPPNAEIGQQGKNKNYPPKNNGTDQQLVNPNLSQQQFQPQQYQMPPGQYPRGMPPRPMIGHQQQYGGYMNMPPMGPPPPGQPYAHPPRPEMIAHQPHGFYSGPPGAIVQQPPMGRGPPINPNSQQIVNNPEMQRQQQQQSQQNGMPPRGQGIQQSAPQLSETRGSTQFSNTHQQQAPTQSSAQQTQHLENYQVYRLLPLFQALKDTMQEMNIPEHKQDLIIQKYDRSIEEEFGSDKFCNNNYGQSQGKNNSRIAGVGEKRVKFDSTCEYYNNVEQVWKFSIKDFKIEYEDKAQMQGNDVSLWSVPHYEHRLRPQKRAPRNNRN